MRTGKVKEFNDKQGFGFIHDDQNNADYFVFFTAIKKEGFKKLEAGQEVEYQLAMGKKGLQAINVYPKDLS